MRLLLEHAGHRRVGPGRARAHRRVYGETPKSRDEARRRPYREKRERFVEWPCFCSENLNTEQRRGGNEAEDTIRAWSEPAAPVGRRRDGRTVWLEASARAVSIFPSERGNPTNLARAIAMFLIEGSGTRADAPRGPEKKTTGENLSLG